ncbi:tubulin-specific chaperone E [Purpureocillium lavendulum]|uniref:Tubulin-specific chaperone E n=1 Tax=Purpureocillium lavendulum TaxID=1247861 RepID=A0AB34G5N8_9HYPO|nr:tubulin-specific chaperone E [Purpureocillium lavendulum]
MPDAPYVGQRVSYGGVLCTIRYVGQVEGTAGSWLGVEWDDETRGKHDGSHKGVRYFSCLSRSATAASFVRPSRPADSPQSFIAALHDKYVAHGPPAEDGAAPELARQIVISGKVAEEKGFDKIRRKLAQVGDLKIVILDGLRVASAVGPDEGSVAETCPRIVHLDLSRNLLEGLGPVVEVCRELRNLQKLSINGNRFQNVLGDKALDQARDAFRGVTELALGQTLLSWDELCHIAVRCPSLAALAVGTNQLASLPAMDYGSLSSTLTSINLEYNDFAAMSDLGSLASLTTLRNLHLKGNSISVMTAPDATTPIFPESLKYLDVSYNNIEEWSFVDALATHFPGLTGLRLAHNPVYDAQRDADTKAASSSEESHMFTIARLAGLKSVNFTQVQHADRTNAEMFYLSRIARQLAAVPEGAAEHTVLAQHPRWAELCGVYGEPDVVRRSEVNPSFLEARLVTVGFHYQEAEAGTSKKMTTRIPKSFDIYAVKGIAGKVFGLPPLRVRLVWETGEWDPVARYDERDGEDSDEDDEDDDDMEASMVVETPPEDSEDNSKETSGRWVKREVELRDGPKQLGYCVDGQDVNIRVEVKPSPMAAS